MSFGLANAHASPSRANFAGDTTGQKCRPISNCVYHLPGGERGAEPLSLAPLGRGRGPREAWEGEGNGAHIVAIARSFLGTPYRHQGSAKGAGCDCLGLIRGVWRELYGVEAEAPPPYRPDWAEICTAEPMLEAARRWLVERPLDTAEPGDVLLFRMSPAASIKHCAILSAVPTAADPPVIEFTFHVTA